MQNCDQGLCQLGVKLFAKESFLLGIGSSLTSRYVYNASNDKYPFLFSCSEVLFQGTCQLEVKLFVEESFVLGIDWSLTSKCNASNDRVLFFFFALLYCDEGICQLGAKLLRRNPFC